MDRHSELDEKQARIAEILDRRDLDAVVLRTPANVAWYSGGGRTHIVATPEIGVADLVVRRQSVEIVTTINESDRLLEEELGHLDATLRVVGWNEDRTTALPTGARVGSDSPLDGTCDVGTDVISARAQLTEAERDRYRQLGRDAARAMTDALTGARAADTEFELSARLAASLRSTGIDPVVLLVAGEDRLRRHRHPLPTSAPLLGCAMAVVCARRHGLIASLTRMVAFQPDDTRDDAYRRLLNVDAAFNTATIAGTTIGHVFTKGSEAYSDNGFPPAEWRRHHQGGPTGYAPRDELATARSDGIVTVGQSFAWNPSAPGIKVEDTVLAASGQPEVLTLDNRWPSTDVAGLPRPLLLQGG